MKTNPQHLALVQTIVDEFYGRQLKDGFDNVWAIKFRFDKMKEFPQIKALTLEGGFFFGRKVWAYLSNNPEDEEKDWESVRLEISRKDFKRLWKMAYHASDYKKALDKKKKAERLEKELSVAIDNFNKELNEKEESSGSV